MMGCTAHKIYYIAQAEITMLYLLITMLLWVLLYKYKLAGHT